MQSFARTDMAGIVDSLAAPLSLINALIVALCIRNSRKVLGRLENSAQSGKTTAYLIMMKSIISMKNLFGI